MSKGGGVVRDTLVVVAVLLAAFGVLLLMVVPTTGGRLSVALLAPIVAWLALPSGGDGRACPVCRSKRSRMLTKGPTFRVATATRAGAPEGLVRVRHGWEVVTTSRIACQRCATVREVTEVRFIERRAAATSQDAIQAASGSSSPVESFSQVVVEEAAVTS